MSMFRKGYVAATVIALGAWSSTPVAAAPFYARGEFNGWSTANPMTDLGGGHYSTTVTGLTPGSVTAFKIAEEDWDPGFPGSDAKVTANAAGAITFHFHEGSFADGWQPESNRVGYDDPGHGWDVMGSFNGWSTGFDLTPAGSGVYTGTMTVASPGTFQFKFRKDEDWGISIGDNFGNSAADNSYTTTVSDEQVVFTLDLPGGRWDAAPVPEPTAMGLMALAGAGLLRRRRA